MHWAIIVGIIVLICGIIAVIVLASLGMFSSSSSSNSNSSPSPSPSQGVGVPSGRFVRISNPSKTWMNIAEIQVSATVGGDNLAAGKGFSQSSGLGDSYPIGNLTDGNLTNFAHTSGDEPPWMMIDLGSVIPIGSITVINRVDCCQGRINGSVIEILDESKNTVWISNPITSPSGTNVAEEGSNGFKTFTLTPPSKNFIGA